jgi:hypothetical protein
MNGIGRCHFESVVFFPHPFVVHPFVSYASQKPSDRSQKNTTKQEIGGKD